jgi:hypothetical protein
MPDIPMLWASGARKEVFELLRTVWAGADPEMRNALARAICAGPPAELLDRVAPEERKQFRDRRIFERLSILQRLGNPPLTAELEAEAARLRQAYPQWRLPEGEQADFGVWFETRWGPETRYSFDDLRALDDTSLVALLLREQETVRDFCSVGASWRTRSRLAPTGT